ncbi:hypothetical protein C8034_v004359 [Colletotrichum sidae]|uniref:Uncharacterized protein n=1 Tax=Colletotrichum sidae TaxID=1347389 RepID=A0A4R8T8E9_9PEZI|nr:hypothetical protein C8034_v004359 [Colletotrichum sidae]
MWDLNLVSGYPVLRLRSKVTGHLVDAVIFRMVSGHLVSRGKFALERRTPTPDIPAGYISMLARTFDITSVVCQRLARRHNGMPVDPGSHMGITMGG